MTVRIFQLAIAFIWCGMLIGISFVEAPLKFQAPNVTLGLGLGIGRLVFFALNKFEIFFAVVLLVTFLVRKPERRIALGYFAVVVLILSLQTLWLLPELDARAEQVIAGIAAPFSNTHYFYIAFETVKLLLVLALGINLARQREV